MKFIHIDRLFGKNWKKVLSVIIPVAVFLFSAEVSLAGSSPLAVRMASVAYPKGKEIVLSGEAAIIQNDPVLKADLQKLGAHLEWVPAPTQSVAATINEAFASGGIEFAHYGDLPSVILNAGGIGTTIVAPGGAGTNVYLIVPIQSTAKSIEDLKGKRIALHRGRPWEYPFARLLQASGFKFSDFNIKNLNPQAGAAALASGDVDALVTLMDVFPLVDKGIAKVLWSSKTPGQPWRIRTELWASKAFVQHHPDVTQAIVNAHVRAAHWISQKENFDEYIRLTTRSGQPEALIRQDYLNEIVSWKDRWEPSFSGVLEHYQGVAGYAKASGLVRREVDAAGLLETKFVQRALKDLKLQNYWHNGKQ
ncbi:MAG: ABC transporter substrate-binding protein [Azoarcus sp.]|nr:ABC transporter substrate-binding protein [Azoarcus sp.]